MGEPQWDHVEVHVSKESTEVVGATTAEGLKSHSGGETEFQTLQQASARIEMPGLGIEFGLELMRQSMERLEKPPTLAMEGQLPVGPLP